MGQLLGHPREVSRPRRHAGDDVAQVRPRHDGGAGIDLGDDRRSRRLP
jgi:hypothetical protein